MDKTRTTIRFVDRLYKELERMANETGQSINSLVVSACWEFVKKWKDEVQNG